MILDNNDFFAGMFDFNGDGKTDFIEAAIGFQILDEMRREEEDGKKKNDEKEEKKE